MKTISAKDLAQKLDQDRLQLIDVREEEEFAAGHIPQAFNLPLSSLENSLSKLDKTQEYHVICQMGGRSARACQFLSEQGYQVVNVDGGVEAYPNKLTK